MNVRAGGATWTRRPFGAGVPSWALDAAALLSLAAMTAFYVAASWRTWADPLVDAGPQLYAAWRVSEGAVLFRDIEWPYGPLSVHFNALVFRIFGTGMAELVAANLLVHFLIVALSYRAFRLAWGRLGAWAACAVFVGVFSFSRLTGTANYTYALPYAHEATHGRLVTLALLLLALRWAQRPSRTVAGFVGLGAGLTAVLKPEFMRAAALLTVAAGAVRHVNRRPLTRGESALAAAAAALPMLGFTLWFRQWTGWGQAFLWANNAWWAAIDGWRESSVALQREFLGVDQAWPHARDHLLTGAYALALLGGIRAAGWTLDRPVRPRVRALAVLGAGAWVLATAVTARWVEAGRCLPGILIAVTAVVVVRMRREWRRTGAVAEESCAALLLALLAAGLLSRMFLNARLYQFGFVQASPAAMVAAAFLAAPSRPADDALRRGRAFTAACGIALLAAGTVSVTSASRWVLSLQTEPVGEERDRFFAYDHSIDPAGALVQQVSRRLAATDPSASVLVLPEGLMVNYLARRATPLPTWDYSFVPDTRAIAREPALIGSLEANPPAYVVIVAGWRDEAKGVRGGAAGERHSRLLEWVARTYVPEAAWGGDPLAPGGGGAIVLRRAPPAADRGPVPGGVAYSRGAAQAATR